MIAALDEHLGLDLTTDSLREHAKEWEEALDDAVEDDPRMSALVAQLQERQAENDQAPAHERIDGEKIAEELRRYLSGRENPSS